jgi:hypothetical protein
MALRASSALARYGSVDGRRRDSLHIRNSTSGRAVALAERDAVTNLGAAAWTLRHDVSPYHLRRYRLGPSRRAGVRERGDTIRTPSRAGDRKALVATLSAGSGNTRMARVLHAGAIDEGAMPWRSAKLAGNSFGTGCGSASDAASPSGARRGRLRRTSAGQVGRRRQRAIQPSRPEPWPGRRRGCRLRGYRLRPLLWGERVRLAVTPRPSLSQGIVRLTVKRRRPGRPGVRPGAGD